MCPARSMSFTRHNRISQGYILTVQYIASLQMWGSGALPTQNGRHRRNPYACRFPYGIDATAGLTIHDKISDTIWQIFTHLFAGALQTWIRNPAPDQRCPHRWSVHRRDTWHQLSMSLNVIACRQNTSGDQRLMENTNAIQQILQILVSDDVIIA